MSPPGDRREPLADTSCPPAAQRKQAIYIYIYNHRVLIVRMIYIYIYICNELIEETASPRKLIFGMWEFFGYGSSKF